MASELSGSIIETVGATPGVGDLRTAGLAALTQRGPDVARRRRDGVRPARSRHSEIDVQQPRHPAVAAQRVRVQQ